MAIDEQFIKQFFSDLTAQARNAENTIEIEDAKKLIEKEKPVVVDVRPDAMYAQGHIPGAKSIPLPKLSQSLEQLPKDKDSKILTVCNLGNSSILGMIFLRAIGYNNVKSINNGTQGWIGKGLPVEK